VSVEYVDRYAGKTFERYNAARGGVTKENGSGAQVEPLCQGGGVNYSQRLPKLETTSVTLNNRGAVQDSCSQISGGFLTRVSQPIRPR
jgi:hypothetical protein